MDMSLIFKKSVVSRIQNAYQLINKFKLFLREIVAC